MLLPQSLGLLSLLRGKHRIQLAPRSADDRVHPRLHLAPDGSHLTHLTIHDRIDPDLLIVGQAEIVSESVPELVIRGWRAMPAVRPEVPTAEHVRQEHQSVHRDAGQPACKGGEQ
jgi:hypothetical protein